MATLLDRRDESHIDSSMGSPKGYSRRRIPSVIDAVTGNDSQPIKLAFTKASETARDPPYLPLRYLSCGVPVARVHLNISQSL